VTGYAATARTQPGAGRIFLAQFRRESAIVIASPGEALQPLAFLFLALALFAIGAGGDPEVLAAQAGAVLWVLVLLATLLGLENLFRRDYDEGVLEQLLLLGQPVFVPLLAKLAVQWLLSGCLIVLLAPLLALMLYLPAEQIGITMLVLLAGSPALTLLGAVAAALTVGLRHGGVLLALLALPLYVPTLVFGAGAISLAGAGSDVTAQVYWLLAISMLALTVAPFGVTAALRISLEQS
jgi:heme exporter protein B